MPVIMKLTRPLMTPQLFAMVTSQVQFHASSDNKCNSGNVGATEPDTVDYEYIEEGQTSHNKEQNPAKSVDGKKSVQIPHQILKEESEKSPGLKSGPETEERPELDAGKKSPTRVVKTVSNKTGDSTREVPTHTVPTVNITTTLLSKPTPPTKPTAKMTAKKVRQARTVKPTLTVIKQEKKTRKKHAPGNTEKQFAKLPKPPLSSGYGFMNNDVIQREEHYGIHDVLMTKEEVAVWAEIDLPTPKTGGKKLKRNKSKHIANGNSSKTNSGPLCDVKTVPSRAKSSIDCDTVVPGNSPGVSTVVPGNSLGVTTSHETSDQSDITDILTFPLFPITETENKNLSQGVTTVPDITIPGFTDILSDVRYPSVSKILNATMPPEQRFLLDRWEKKMIAQMGYERFQEYRQETFAKGRNFHTCVEEKLGGKPDSMIEVLEFNSGHWSSIQSVFPDIHQVEELEQKVQHPHLYYQGVFDCIAKYKDTLCVIDWKTSKKIKSSLRWTYDNPIQLAAYMGAINYDPSYNIQVDSALLVIAYQDGRKAHTHYMSTHTCTQYWNIWLQRVYKYWHLYMLNKV